MITIEIVKEFLGWCTIINLGILMVAAIFLVLMRNQISKIHAKMFGISEVNLSYAYFQYLAQYKMAIIVLNLVPYIALRVIT